MTTRILSALALAASLAAGGAAFATESATAPVGPEMIDQIRAKLTAEGYEVRKIDIEDGMAEAYVVKDGQKMEVYLDAALNIVQTKAAD